MSCAGHLDAGEIPADGIRELREELGIEVDFHTLHPVGVFKSSHLSEDVKDNEFCHVFVLIRDEETLSAYSPAVGELSGLYLIDVNDLQNICSKNVETVPITGFEMDDTGHCFEQTISLRLSEMVEHELSYYEMLFKVIRWI